MRERVKILGTIPADSRKEKQRTDQQFDEGGGKKSRGWEKINKGSDTWVLLQKKQKSQYS